VCRGNAFAKPYQPKIMGQLSQKDVSEISKTVFSIERSRFESDVDYDLVHMDVLELVRSTCNHLRNKITVMAVLPNGQVFIAMNEYGGMNLVKDGNCWVLAPQPRPQTNLTRLFLQSNQTVPTNAAPVSQGGAAR